MMYLLMNRFGLSLICVAAAEFSSMMQLKNSDFRQSPSYRYTKPWLIPEGIDTLPDGDFLVGSMGGQGLHRVRMVGEQVQLSMFASPRPEMTSVIGIHVDRSRNRVYAVNSPPFTGTEFPDTPGVAGIFVFNLNGDVKCFSSFGNEMGAFPNDLTVGRKGVIYSTDSLNGIIWKTTKSCRSEILIEIPEWGSRHYPGEALGSPGITFMNGIDRIPGKNQLLVSSIGGGLVRINTKNKKITPVQADNSTVVKRIDGIVVVSSGLAYGVNGEFSKVVKLETTDRFKTVKTQASRAITCMSPTTATIKDDEVWVTCVSGFGEGPYAIEKVKFDPLAEKK